MDRKKIQIDTFPIVNMVDLWRGEMSWEVEGWGDEGEISLSTQYTSIIYSNTYMIFYHGKIKKGGIGFSSQSITCDEVKNPTWSIQAGKAT